MSNLKKKIPNEIKQDDEFSNPIANKSFLHESLSHIYTGLMNRNGKL